MGEAVTVGGESVGATVLVLVIVGDEVGGGAAATSGLPLKAKKTITAPIVRKSASKPRAAGRLSVIAGIRLPCTAFAGLAGFSKVPISAPHTRQRVASSERRVPQVGQSLVGVVGVSGVIGLICREIKPDLAHYTSLLQAVGSSISMEHSKVITEFWDCERHLPFAIPKFGIHPQLFCKLISIPYLLR